MRCPKCGFISFDHLETCLKCKKDIRKVAEILPGSVFNVTAPLFLHFDSQRDEVGDDVELIAEEEAETFDLVDEDLEVLAGEQEKDVDISFAREDAAEAVADEDREIEFDLSQFGDAAKTTGVAGAALAGQEPTAPAEPRVSLDLPDLDDLPDLAEEPPPAAEALVVPEELLDISDLAPPGKGARLGAKPPVESGFADDLADLELDDLDIDLDLGELDDPADRKTAEPEEAVLTLDGLDFSTITPPDETRPRKKKAPPADDDLDFDIDLGDLSLDRDK